jgi:hypothetical protein
MATPLISMSERQKRGQGKKGVSPIFHDFLVFLYILLPHPDAAGAYLMLILVMGNIFGV